MWLYLLGGQAVVRGVYLVCGTGDRWGARLRPLLVNRMRWLASFRRLHQLAGWVEWRPVACGRPVAAERGCMASVTTRGHFCCLLRVPGVDDCWWHARRGVEELRHAALTIGRCLGGVDCWSRSSVLREQCASALGLVWCFFLGRPCRCTVSLTRGAVCIWFALAMPVQKLS